MRRRISAGVVAGLLAVTIQSIPSTASAATACYKHKSEERSLATLLNEARAKKGYDPLRLDRHLLRVARHHNKEMDARDKVYFTPDRTLRRRVTKEERLGENVALGRDINSVHRALMDSKTYRRNLRNPKFRHVGVAVRTKDGRVWATAVFEGKTNPGTRLKLCTNGGPSPDPTVSPSPDPSPSDSPSPDPSPSDEPDPVDPGLDAEAINANTVSLSWTPPGGTARVQVQRDGRVLDSGPVSGTMSFSDKLLWESTTYTYNVRAYDSAGNQLALRSATVTTPARTSALPRLYSVESPWNTPIPQSAAIDPNSNAMVQTSLLHYKSGSNFANSDSWGIATTYASSLSKTYSVGCLKYGCSTAISGRIPKSARTTTGSDGHLAVIDQSSGKELDMWQGVHNTTTDSWTAGSRYLMDAAGRGSCGAPGTRCGSAVASGFALMAGVVRPEEIAQGRINHALAFTTPNNRSKFIACPANWTDGHSDDPNSLPEGARIQLDPSFNVDAQPWPRWKKVIARALQEYGAINVDNGGSVAFRGEANINRGYDAWSKASTPINGSFADLPWERMRVLKVEQCGTTG